MNSDINLFFALVASAVTAFLGFLVWLHDRRSISNIIFIVHALVGSIWALVSYVSIVSSPPSVLFWIRMVVFLAVPHVFLFLIFVLNFPETNLNIKKGRFFLILAVALFMMFLVLTPFVFERVIYAGNGYVPVPGKLMPLFAPILVVSFLLTAILVVRRFFAAGKYPDKLIRRQWLAIGTGLLVSYSLLIFLVFVRVIAFNDTTYVPYSPLFILPIFIGASYAIFRHQLFNIKILAAELLTFALLLAGFVQVLLTETTVSLVLGVAVVFFILITGILLVKNVLKEVRQREQLQELDLKLERANRKLKVLDQARAEFITMASHQLRTPPATIKWYLAAILGGDFGNLSPDALQALRKTQATNNALISLIDDMLNVSRIERGKLEFVFEPTDILKITQFTVEQLIPMAEQKHLQLEFMPPKENLSPIVADKEKLRQVINNLIDNAIKYTKAGKITVSISMSQGNVIIKVSDTGKGMPIEEQKKVFQKFGRGKDANNYSTGLGLGLYLAKVVVEAHRGKIWAESKGSGKGSSFLVSLPIENKLQLSRLIYDLTQHQT